MAQALYVVGVLACPVGMCLVMWLTMRRGRGQRQSPNSPTTEEIASLRAEIDQLRATERR